MRFVFFGTPAFAAMTLEELAREGLVPLAIVTAPDKPKGRKLILTPSEANVWGGEHGISVLTPEKLDGAAFDTLRALSADMFVVSAYGKIIPKRFLELPPLGTLNLHPSLLPKFRGASPIESAILSDEKETGVTIILLDEETDHGPILLQETVPVAPWPPKASDLARTLAARGGALLARAMRGWNEGTLASVPQEHGGATFTKKIRKEDGLLDLDGDPMTNLRKIRAFDEWPGAYFFLERGGKRLRIKATDAEIADGKLRILRVIPEGKREMEYQDFLRGSGSSGAH